MKAVKRPLRSLSAVQVREILGNKDGLTVRQLADCYLVSPRTIRRVQLGKMYVEFAQGLSAFSR